MDFALALFFDLFFHSFAYLWPYNAIVAGSLAIAAGSKWKLRGVLVVLIGTIIFHAFFVCAKLSGVH